MPWGEREEDVRGTDERTRTGAVKEWRTESGRKKLGEEQRTGTCPEA